MFLLLLYFIGLPGALGRTMKWSGGTAGNVFSSADNWSGGHAPCSSETAVFPSSALLEVEIPGDVSALVEELVMPSDGELLLLPGAKLFLSPAGQVDHKCQGGENRWLSRPAADWLDPLNWEGSNSATPDLERVPCPTDRVEFSSLGEYRIQLPPFEVRVSSFYSSRSKTEWTRSLLEEYLRGPGAREFLGGPLEVTGEACGDPAGCECPAQSMAWICPRLSCHTPRCLNPIKPLGDCCQKCGAYLLYGFSEDTVLADVERDVSAELGREASWHVSRTMGNIQIVLSQDEDGQDVEGLARKLNTKLLASGLGLRSKTLSLSGPYVGPDSGLSPFSMLFLTLALALLGFGATFYYFEKNRGMLPTWLGGGGPPTFARFQNLSGIVEIRPPVPRPSVSRLPSESRGFDNPMYTQGVAGPIGKEALLGDDPSEESSGSEDSVTPSVLTTLDDPVFRTMEDVPIGKLID